MPITLKPRRRLLLVRLRGKTTHLLVETASATPADTDKIKGVSLKIELKAPTDTYTYTTAGKALWVSPAGHLAVYALTVDKDVPKDLFTARKITPADVSVTIDNDPQKPPPADLPPDLYDE